MLPKSCDGCGHRKAFGNDSWCESPRLCTGPGYKEHTANRPESMRDALRNMRMLTDDHGAPLIPAGVILDRRSTGFDVRWRVGER